MARCEKLWVCLDRTILLKLKTENWKHCNKIIFKCVNSSVKPIFNEKVAKKWNLWVHKRCTDALFTGKSQHLRLLFMYCSLNRNRIPPKTREKKKKKNEKNENAASPKRWCSLSAIQTITVSPTLFIQFGPQLIFYQENSTPWLAMPTMLILPKSMPTGYFVL